MTTRSRATDALDDANAGTVEIAEAVREAAVAFKALGRSLAAIQSANEVDVKPALVVLRDLHDEFSRRRRTQPSSLVGEAA